MRAIAACLAVLVTAAAPGPAAGAADVAAAVRACRAEPDDARRLACYDRAAGGDEGAAAAASEARPAAAPAAPAAATEDDFGRERQRAYEEQQQRASATRAVGELRSSVASLEKRIDGLLTLTLDNGQVWRQVRPDSRFSINQGDEILIQPGTLGSFILSGPTKKSTRVTRLK